MKKKIAYSGYIIIVMVFFLYYLFPGDAVTAYINYQIKHKSPGVQLSIMELKPSFPPGIKLLAPNLLYQNQSLITADFLDVKPSYISLFASDKIFFITGDISEGRLDSTVCVANISENPALDINASFENIQISQIPAIKEFESYLISGIADGNIVYSNKEDPAGKGNAGMIVTDSTVQFVPALFGIDQLAFKTIDADFEIINQRVTLKKLNISSREISAHASGLIVLMKPLYKSTINIHGEIKPHPTFIKQLSTILPIDMIAKKKSKTGGIPFRITGSLDRPNFSFR